MSVAVRERPVLFSGPMVKALLDGRKTQTRRVVKPQPPSNMHRHAWFDAPVYGWTYEPEPAAEWHRVRCPYGQPGDRLWVRETWALVRADEDGIDDWVDMGPIPDSLPWPGWQVWHRAGHSWAYDHPDDRGFRWRPSIHMPRWASRITLRIEDVRVERLNDISEADAIAEGIDSAPCVARPGERVWCDYAIPQDPFEWYASPIDSFRSLWDSINGKRPGCSWAANPWVWALTFSREAPHA